MKQLKFKLLCVFLLMNIIHFKIFCQVDLQVNNIEVAGTDLTFDIYLTATSSTFGLSEADFILTFNNSQFTSPIFSKVSNPSPIFGFLNNGYCTFISTSLTGPQGDPNLANTVQKPYFDNTSTSIIGNTLTIGLSEITPTNTADYDLRIAQIDGNSVTHRLGKFKITGYNGADNGALAELVWDEVNTAVSEVIDNDPSFPTQTLGVNSFCVFLSGNCSTSTTCPATIFVKHDANGNNDGTSWTDAYTDLQDAIDDACATSAEIWVAQGTYKPIQAPDGTPSAGPTDRNNAFHINTDMEIYGGFVGTETMLSQRPAGAKSTLSGDFLDNDVVTGGGSTLSITNNDENAYHVMVTINLTNASVIDGFNFIRGNAFPLNSLIFNELDGNNAFGGGMYNYYSSPLINNCCFIENKSTQGGGGQYNSDNSFPTIKNCIFSKNTSFTGGGQNNSLSAPTMINCSFIENFASNVGGGQIIDFSTSPILTNCTYYRNFSYIGGGLSNSSSTTTLTNCIFWGNTAMMEGDNIDNSFSTPSIKNSLIQGSGGSSSWVSSFGIDGGNNIDADPIFNDPANGDYSLKSCSPALNVGDNTVNTSTVDLAGNPRIFNTTIDMGAYEFQGTFASCCPFSSTGKIYVDINATAGNNDGTTWTNAYTNLQDAIDNQCDNAEIWVAQGTYKPTDTPDGTTSTGPTDRNNAFHLNTDMKIYGGFAGTETMLSQRPAGAKSTLSGDIDNTPNDNSGNAYHVMIVADVTAAAVMDGFIIEKGNANGTGSISYNSRMFTKSFGGGQHIRYSSPNITNTIFSNNEASQGGGQYNEFSFPTLVNCIFSNNSAGHIGGGQSNSLSFSILTNCTFSNNLASNGGGGLYSLPQSNSSNSSNSSEITNCIFWENMTTAFNFGHNIFLQGANPPIIKNSLIQGSGGSNSWGGGFGIDGGNNVDADPLFTDAVSGDYTLKMCSPAIDVGDNSANTTTIDLGGNNRIFNNTIDLGAYEYSGLICPSISISATTASVSEQNTNKLIYEFERQNGDLTQGLTVHFQINSSSTAEATDYIVTEMGTGMVDFDESTLKGTITFPVNQTKVQLEIVPQNDGMVENNETVVVELIAAP